MSRLSVNFDRDRESIISRDDFNRLFSNARAVRDASAKLVTLQCFSDLLFLWIGVRKHASKQVSCEFI